MTNNPDHPLAVALRDARSATGLNQKRFAPIAGVSQSRLCQMERGRIDPRWSTVVKIVGSLGLPLETLFPTDAIVQAAKRVNAKRRESRKERT